MVPRLRNHDLKVYICIYCNTKAFPQKKHVLGQIFIFIENVTGNKQLDYLRWETLGTVKFPSQNPQSKGGRSEAYFCLYI